MQTVSFPCSPYQLSWALTRVSLVHCANLHFCLLSCCAVPPAVTTTKENISYFPVSSASLGHPPYQLTKYYTSDRRLSLFEPGPRGESVVRMPRIVSHLTAVYEYLASVSICYLGENNVSYISPSRKRISASVEWIVLDRRNTNSKRYSAVLSDWR